MSRNAERRETAKATLTRALATDVTRTGPKSFEQLAQFALNLGAFKVVKRPMYREDHGILSGMLVPVEGGCLVAINERIGASRQLYSLAHEIGHLLHLRDRDSTQSTIRREKYRAEWDRHDDPDEERSCEVIAAELLMPEHTFADHLRNLPDSLTSVSNLSQIFGTSITATAIRIVELNSQPRLLTRWRQDKRTVGAVRLSWQIRNSINGPSVEVIPSNSKSFAGAKAAWSQGGLKVTDETLLERVAQGDSRYVGFPVFKTESIGFGVDKSRFVLSMSHLEHIRR
ncbi:MAG: ImmA/IrrE family metallo-endopeptidase [SAR202 cluster bacterium]|jgi:hypothetical protein|nr:hypothetical protein [Chloroflexota bacterium]MDP6421931.1 ImmA/IrrE family metallo-endopeptidase [SAR202 cluster bacterium]HAL49308.1 hypothetical protein [Dehalococcoidia bacterium]MDP6663385.1 ImmA/IrrE family metallo-endopeptidase [SAR202 cluster bacterium]MDP6799574.1 ImmA/IrrE family metallo-endopeptidase [SAR202 cluster bacterium]|tara:strand:- start:341 stop:1195 length:855 start_codon:yes stop_codon:yes gene_type:complete